MFLLVLLLFDMIPHLRVKYIVSMETNVYSESEFLIMGFSVRRSPFSGKEFSSGAVLCRRKERRSKETGTLTKNKNFIFPDVKTSP